MNPHRGGNAFLLGLFLLPSSALLSGICLFVACVSGSRGRDWPLWRDRWSQPFLLAALLMLVGAVVGETGTLAWAGLANWLPFFWAFWAFQPHLASEHQRRQAAWMLVAGTLPVVLTGLGQMFLGWEGPWQLGGGAIIWFVAPGGQPQGRLSALFDYANIAGAWLAVVWSFALAAVLARRDPPWCRALAFLLANAAAYSSQRVPIDARRSHVVAAERRRRFNAAAALIGAAAVAPSTARAITWKVRAASLHSTSRGDGVEVFDSKRSILDYIYVPSTRRRHPHAGRPGGRQRRVPGQVPESDFN